MSRDTDLIKQQMVDQKEAETSLDSIDSDSQVSIWGLFLFVVAQSINLFEQLLDIKQEEIEETAAKSVYGIEDWIRERVLEFQYSATDPQIAVIVDNQVTYSTIDAALRIITRCAVNRSAVAVVEIKVAKGDPPEQLSSLEEDAILSYVNSFAPAGITYTITNKASDKLYIEADVYYAGEYAAVISDNVIAALEAYMANLEFNGQIKVSDIEKTIKDVAGVTDLKLITVKARQDATVFGSAIVVFDLATGVNLLTYSTGAGYVVEETESGQGFTDKINFIAAP